MHQPVRAAGMAVRHKTAMQDKIKGHLNLLEEVERAPADMKSVPEPAVLLLQIQQHPLLCLPLPCHQLLRRYLWSPPLWLRSRWANLLCRRQRWAGPH